MNASSIKQYSAADLARRRARGESRTDLPRLRAKTPAELERDIANDPDFRDIPHDWAATAEAVMPTPKRLLSLRIDDEVVKWFIRQGPGYQTRINAVLRAYVEHAGKRGTAETPPQPTLAPHTPPVLYPRLHPRKERHTCVLQ